MAAAPIDLSAGMVPIQAAPIDISAGLVPKDQPDTRSLFQKAKDNFNANTQGAQPGDGAVKGFIENIGQGGGQFVRSLAHPLDQAHSEVDALRSAVADPTAAAKGALDQAHTEVDTARADPSRFVGNAIGQIGTGAIVGGAAAEAIPKVVGAVDAAIEKIPNRAKAGAIFNKLNTDLAQQPVTLDNSAAPLQRAIEIGARGGTIPGPVSALLQRAQAVEPMTFPEARDYQASLSDLSASDKMAMDGRMKGAVAQLNMALYQDVRQAAESGGGYGSDFDKAMTQYRQASNAKEIAQKVGKLAVKAAVGGGATAAGVGIIKDALGK